MSVDSGALLHTERQRYFNFLLQMRFKGREKKVQKKKKIQTTKKIKTK